MTLRYKTDLTDDVIVAHSDVSKKYPVMIMDTDDSQQVVLTVEGAKTLYTWLRQHGYGDEPLA